MSKKHSKHKSKPEKAAPPLPESSTEATQRYAPHLPVAEELVLFSRGWYNRAGVEHVTASCNARASEPRAARR